MWAPGARAPGMAGGPCIGIMPTLTRLQAIQNHSVAPSVGLCYWNIANSYQVTGRVDFYYSLEPVKACLLSWHGRGGELFTGIIKCFLFLLFLLQGRIEKNIMNGQALHFR